VRPMLARRRSRPELAPSIVKHLQMGLRTSARFGDRAAMAVTEASHAAARQLDDLYRQHGPSVFRYALAVLGNHADAEDVTQTTFLNAYRSLEQGVHPRKPLNWLLTIASNAIKQRFRQEQSRPRQVELDRDVAGVTADEEAPSVGELLTALSKIPPQQRQAIVLREFEGRSYVEIADILGITTSALETLLFRARRSLAEELEHHLTCTEAQLAVSRAADERLGRKERRRLREHLAECPDCAQFARLQQRHRRALRGLALVPIPLSLTLFKSLEGSSTAAAATLPTLGAGAGAGAGAVAVGSGAGGGAAAGGGILAGGVALKAAAVVVAVGVAGGAAVGTESVVSHRHHSPTPAAKTSSQSRGASGLAGAGQGAQHKGKALGRIGEQPGLARSANAPGRVKKATGLGRASTVAHARSTGRALGHSRTKTSPTQQSSASGAPKTNGPKKENSSIAKTSPHSTSTSGTTTTHGKSQTAQAADAANQAGTGSSASSGKDAHGKPVAP
jgi:RNA polymerase sigma factor (sigma-70 family)